LAVSPQLSAISSASLEAQALCAAIRGEAPYAPTLADALTALQVAEELDAGREGTALLPW
jgi:hypothetical protein